MLDLSKEVIEEIRHRCDISDVISSCGVQLKRSGSSSLKGLCPFHQEKTPSFHVDTARQSFHCFGCGADGDVIIRTGEQGTGHQQAIFLWLFLLRAFSL